MDQTFEEKVNQIIAFVQEIPYNNYTVNPSSAIGLETENNGKSF